MNPDSERHSAHGVVGLGCRVIGPAGTPELRYRLVDPTIEPQTLPIPASETLPQTTETP